MSDQERLRRWRLILGDEGRSLCPKLDDADSAMDGCLSALYDGKGIGRRPDPNQPRGLGWKALRRT
jgi:hypothetical protein